MIRNYTPADRQACILIFNGNTPLYFDPAEYLYLENWLNAKDQGRIAYPGNRVEEFYVLEQQGRVIACGGFYISQEARANMVWGMVENEFHRQGHGSALLQHRIAHIRAQYPAISITLDTSQHCFKFFEQMGFFVTKITEHAYGPGLHRCDMALTTG